MPLRNELILKLHLVLGLLCTLFLVVMGATGSFLAYEYSFDRLLNPQLFHVLPQAQRQSLAKLIEIVHQANPNAKIVLIDLAGVAGNRPDVSYQVQVMRRGSSTPTNVFIDPYTGHLLGERNGIGFAAEVHEFHFNLGLGEAGRLTASVFSGGMTLLAVTGLVLWWPRKLLRIRRNSSAGRANFELHNAIGFYSSIFIVLFGVTGIGIYGADVFAPALDRLAHQASRQHEPTVFSQPAVVGTPALSPDRAAVIAATTIPGARVSQVVLPKGPQGGYRVRLKFPEDRQTPGRSSVHIDQYTGNVMWSQSTREAAIGTRYIRFWNREIHSGTAFGPAFQVAAAATGLAIPLLAITGPLIWWRRYRK